MSSAKKFGQSLLEGGKNATFAKTDLQDAYKILSCSLEERKIFGFQWLGKSFLDISTPFGSKAAPVNFDDFGETLVNIAKSSSDTPARWVHRQLDDVPIISPVNSGITEKFTKHYLELCKSANIPTAEPCPKFDKAFGPSTMGTVLGIVFDSAKMEWKLPSGKNEETIDLLQNFLNKSHCTLLEFQKLHGKLNDFCQMHSFARGFKFSQNSFLKEFEARKTTYLLIPNPLKKELLTWLKMVRGAEKGQKIPMNVKNTPFIVEKFISDAAGPKITWTLSKGHVIDESVDSGFASLGYNDSGIFFSCTYTWPLAILRNFPSNSAILECIGLLAPFIANPKMVKNKNILLEVDNTTCVFAWQNRTPKCNDIFAILIQTLHIFEAAIPCRIFMEHVKRRSNHMAILADNLSRINTTTIVEKRNLAYSPTFHIDGPITDWFLDPRSDWDLPEKIVNYALKKL